MTNQVQIPEAFKELFVPARYKAYYGGRGSAKSHSFAAALVLRGAERPLRWLFCREIQKSLNVSVYQLLKDKIELFKLDDAYHITRDSIQGQNGTKFFFAGLRTNPDAIKSMEGLDGAWVEEADRVSQSSLDLLLPTIRKPHSEVWFSWNPRSVNDPVHNMFVGGEPPPNSITHKVSWRDNPFFPEVLRDEMNWMKRRDHDKWLHIWEGECLQRSESKVFRNWKIEDLDDAIPADVHPRFGADWGYSIDPTVCMKIYRFKRQLYIARERYKIGVEVDDLPAFLAGTDTRGRWENPKQYAGLTDIMNSTVVADPSRPETISHLRRRGFRIMGAIRGARSIEEGIDFLQSLDIAVHPSCKHAIDELSTYSYKVDKLTDEILSELEDKNNHVVDSLRYAVEAERRARRKGVATYSETITL